MDWIVPDPDITKKYIVSGEKPRSPYELLNPIGHRTVEYWSDEEIAASKGAARLSQIRRELDC